VEGRPAAPLGRRSRSVYPDAGKQQQRTQVVLRYPPGPLRRELCQKGSTHTAINAQPPRLYSRSVCRSPLPPDSRTPPPLVHIGLEVYY